MSPSLTILICSLTFLVGLQATNSSCSKPHSPPCDYTGGAVFILDTTAYLTNQDISNEFELIRKKVFPFLPKENIWIGIMSYGTGSTQTNPFKDKMDEACFFLDTLEVAHEHEGSYFASLLTALKVYKVEYYDDGPQFLNGQKYPVFLFSGSQNQEDINAASNFTRLYLNQTSFNVILMNNADFTDFPADSLYYFEDFQYFDYHYCLPKIVCGYDPNCNMNDMSSIAHHRPTTTASPISPHSGNSTSHSCLCQPRTIWNDVIYLIESSDATQYNSLDDMWVYILTVSGNYNIQKNDYKGTNYHMRVGIIVYSDKAQLVAPLGSVTYDDMLSIDLPFLGGGDKGTNIKEAVQLAMKEFESERSRKNARPVIVLLASTFNSQDENSPIADIKAFQEDDGISIVYNYVPEKGLPEPELKLLASEGYFLTESTISNMLDAQCDANCFCRPYYSFYSNFERNVPANGCYMGINLPSNYDIAKRNCQMNYDNSTLPTVDDSKTNQFLSKMVNDAYYIGLREINGQFLWNNGAQLGSWQPWTSPPIPGEGSCVISDQTSKWTQVQCREGYYYVCQSASCDSTNYCENPKQ